MAPGVIRDLQSSVSDKSDDFSNGPIPQRKRVVVVGLGMVGIAFIEKLMKLDAKRREYDVVVIGEEAHLAYNRVGLTSFFQHRDPKNLYLNSQDWYANASAEALNYHLNTKVTEIIKEQKLIKTSTGETVSYDVLVLATGSDALLPRNTPGLNAKGVFVYRTIEDLQKLIEYAETVKGTIGAVVGGGLLGLEAAKAMMDLETFKNVKLLERNRWVLSRQLDQEAGTLVVELISKLGLDVMLKRRVLSVQANDQNVVEKVIFEDGETLDCTCIMFCTGIRARDELAQAAGIKCADGSGGGVVVNGSLETSEPDIYAIGECASWENQTFGLIAPGIEMADVLAFNLTQAKIHKARTFKRPDLSTKLKLLGVEVASFGDFFADRDGPKDMPGRKHVAKNTNNIKPDSNPNGAPSSPQVKALTYKDPFQAVYKKYLFTLDGEYLLGGMMIGDTKDYIKLVPMVKKQQKLDVPPSQFILGTSKEGEDDGADLDDDTQICSCHNVTKGDVCKVVKEGTCKSIGDVKSCTKAGTGCGGCMPLVQSIFNKQMKDMGQEISNHLCPHFKYSRQDLYNIISIKEIRDMPALMQSCGTDPNSLGCEVCKPTVGSIFASLYNQHVMGQKMHGLQDTNDKFLANIQRNGTFSVIPRIAGGEITADKLISIGTVAKRFGLYLKITGGQRIDMFGAKKQDLPAIWRELIDAGMESGHAYAKSLRTVKSCVGTTWCRFGIGDSVGMAVRLEERYKSIRSPHKLKGGVSGCVRECAEAQNKDFGLIASEKGFNIFVGGNGGMRPRHSEILARDVPPDEVVPILDRYLMFYVRTADKLQRTARWIEALPGGIEYLREVILNDKLGIAADLERQMQALVGTFFCEWTQVLSDPELEAKFAQFANTPETLPTMDNVQERGQTRPAYWAKDAATVDFKNHTWSSLSWQPMLEASYFRDAASHPSGMSAAVKRGDTQLAIFWAKGRLYCTQQMCPHKRSFVLSDGLLGEDAPDPEATDKNSSEPKIWVSCPNHKRNFLLNGERSEESSTAPKSDGGASTDSGGCAGMKAGTCTNDDSLSLATFAVEQRDDGWVYVKLPPVEELDALLGTKRWMVRKEDGEDPFVKMDLKLGAMGRKGRRVKGGIVEQDGNDGVRKGVHGGTKGLDW